MPTNPRQTLSLTLGILLLATCGATFAQPVGPRPAGPPARSATLLGKVEHDFDKWFERAGGQGENATYVEGDDNDHRRRRLSWDQVGPQVTQIVEFEVSLPGELFIVAEFTMPDRAEYKLKDRLHSVGGLYPAKLERVVWKDLGAGSGGFNISEKVGQTARPPFQQFTFQGQRGDRQVRVSGKGMAAEPGKYRLRVTAAVAKDIAAWFPSRANVYVYFAPSLPGPGPDRDDRRDDRPGPPTELMLGAIKTPPGATIGVPLALKNADRLGDLNVTISYPTDLLQLDGIDKGAMIGPGTQFASQATGANPADTRLRIRSVGIAMASRTGLSGTGELAVLKFTVIGKPGQRGAISAAVTSAHKTSEQAVRIDTSSATVTVGGVVGDADGDGRITSRDALMALQLSAKATPNEPQKDPALDIDGDGLITAKDARWLLQLAVGMRPADFQGPLPPFGVDADPQPWPGPRPGPNSVADAQAAYSEYLLAFDQLMELLDREQIDRPLDLRAAQELLRQTDRAYQVTQTRQAQAAFEAAHAKLTDLLGKVAIESPAAAARAQQKMWSAKNRYDQLKNR